MSGSTLQPARPRRWIEQRRRVDNAIKGAVRNYLGSIELRASTRALTRTAQG